MTPADWADLDEALREEKVAEPVGLDLDAIEARANAATPGPWELWDCTVVQSNDNDDDPLVEIAECQSGDPYRVKDARPYKANAEFIAQSRNDVPLLTAEIRFLRSVRDNQAAVIRKQRAEIDTLRYDLKRALDRETAERDARIDAEERAFGAEQSMGVGAGLILANNDRPVKTCRECLGSGYWPHPQKCAKCNGVGRWH